MDAIKFRVNRVIDFGTVVSIVGVDESSGLPVVVHIDHRPFEVVQKEWVVSGLPDPVSFDADSLTLSLNIDCDNNPDTRPEIIDAPAA